MRWFRSGARAVARCGLLLLGTGLAAIGTARAQPAAEQPVRFVAEGRLAVSSAAGQGVLPVALSTDWSRPLPSVTRAVIMVHGTLRDVDASLRLAEQARTAAQASADTTLLVAPQFLAEQDVETHHLPGDFLRWDTDGWKTGRPARGPVGLSSFNAFDALLARLADPALFPALRHVVVAGHSAGAQVVQLYAVVGRGEAALTARKIAVRYVVANPSSYLWFGNDRPRPVDPATCPDVDQWQYGFRHALLYVGETRGMERRYVAKDVVYLLGEADRDPNHRELDRSCAAMAQGENRFARGMQFMLALEVRRPNRVHNRVLPLVGVGHDAATVFGSVCGMAALFGREGCVGLRD